MARTVSDPGMGSPTTYNLSPNTFYIHAVAAHRQRCRGLQRNGAGKICDPPHKKSPGITKGRDERCLGLLVD